jgi:phage gpG-like protein
MNFNFQQAQAQLKQVWLTLPYKVGVIMVAFTKDRFKYQNWMDTYPENWKARKTGAKRNVGRALLIDKGRLIRDIRILRTTPNSVTEGTDLPYARAHNDGFRGTVIVPAHLRKRFGKSKVYSTYEFTKTGKRRSRTVKFEIQVKEHTMRMNLPRRRFMGESRYLSMQINRLITSQINSIFK